MGIERSTRLSIVEHSLADVQARLDDLGDSPEARNLVSQALDYEAIVSTWLENPPNEETRQALLRKVLDLNVAVIRLAGESGVLRGSEPEPEEEDFPRPVDLTQRKGG